MRSIVILSMLAVLLIAAGEATAATLPCQRIISAEVVALDQIHFYNRFGAYNPYGMMYALLRDVVPIDPTLQMGPDNVELRPTKRPRPLTLRANVGDCIDITFYNWLNTVGGGDSPATRTASMHVNGLQYNVQTSDGSRVGYNSSSLISPGQTAYYRWYADEPGRFMIYSNGALAGGQGDGGSLVLGLFGAINVEPAGSVWYRSQLTNYELNLVRDRVCTTICEPDINDPVESTTTQTQTQEAAIPGQTCTTKCNWVYRYDTAVDPSRDFEPVARILNDNNEIVHSDLNAIISNVVEDCAQDPPSGSCGMDFREFTVLFHDELKAIQAFPELNDPVFHGVRDGFGVNYGASGLGAILLANFNGIGPAAECDECKYEEFFLESWANGDPALLVDYTDDPSNIHHSYLGDPVRFRNIHVGPKETHIFHLHAHQWLHEPKGQNSSYLDSMTIGPGSAFTYDINYGGSGNRNLTPGDSIFHCHLYPHFAQGMWELWRVHDVFEDGSVARNLPDAEITGGTPNPAILPMPGVAMAPDPTASVPGFPFFMAADRDPAGKGAIPGRRPPQPPMDLEFDGGLPRHVIVDAQVYKGRRGLFDKELKLPNGTPLPAELSFLPQNGTTLEVNAMNFHAQATHTTRKPDGSFGTFYTNGLPPSPGAPFAEPCDPAQLTGYRDYRAAAIELDLVVNDYGWHDPQARIDVLNEDVGPTLNGTRETEPFFFRANSGECVTFHHTNLLPSVLQADPFQIFTPTDTIGQHIHLVKFDVTSSDGSGNGFNYEDGTFAPEEVLERIHAYNEWIAQGGSGTPLTEEINPWFTEFPGLALGAQTTIQRWWADPLLNLSGLDRTIRTVFTHDHFAPSSIQHHGFYAALVVEPAGSRWYDPERGEELGLARRFIDGGPTLFKANIETGDLDVPGDGIDDSYREFNLAFADFAIVFDDQGNPINPPEIPEAISADDPGTMLINYRNEPIPLRISPNANGQTQRGGPKGDLAFAFSSRVHGDPSTPILPVYEKDRVKVRLIQGAQEEMHVYSMNGLRWPHEASDPKSGWYNAQAIGISEHFEMVTPVPQACPSSRRFDPWELDDLAYEAFEMLDDDPTTTVGDPTSTQVKAAVEARLQYELSEDIGFTDAGITAAAYDSVDRILTDSTKFNNLKNGMTTEPLYLETSMMTMGGGTQESYYLVDDGSGTYAEGSATSITRNRREGCFGDYMYSSSPIDDLWNGMWGIMRAYRDERPGLVPLSNNQPPSFHDFPHVASGQPSLHPHPQEPNPCTGLDVNGNPKVVTGTRTFDVVAIPVPLTYNTSPVITDPTGLIFVPAADEADVLNGVKPPEPLVIRAAAGECITVNLTNHLPPQVPDLPEDARLPEIVALTVDDLKPSRRVSLHPQLVDVNIRTGDGSAVGYNPDQTVRRNKAKTYTWYVPLDLRAPIDPGSVLGAGPESLGGTNLRDFADVIKHGSQGLFGGLMLEPAGATWTLPYANGATADVTTPSGSFREFVLFEQDGLNLRDENGNRIPDLPGNPADAAEADPEDTGSKGFNYKTEPFWARLCSVFIGGVCDFPNFDLNNVDQSDVLSSHVYGDPATPIFRATAGDAIRFRLLQPDGRSRQHAWALNAHSWRHEPANAFSMVIGAQGGMSVGRHFNIEPLYGAGGVTETAGDYLYRDMGSLMFSGGLWGIMRVTPEPPNPPPPNPCGKQPCQIEE